MPHCDHQCVLCVCVSLSLFVFMGCVVCSYSLSSSDLPTLLASLLNYQPFLSAFSNMFSNTRSFFPSVAANTFILTTVTILFRKFVFHISSAEWVFTFLWIVDMSRNKQTHNDVMNLS